MKESPVIPSIVWEGSAMLPGAYYRMLGVIITCIEKAALCWLLVFFFYDQELFFLSDAL